MLNLMFLIFSVDVYIHFFCLICRCIVGCKILSKFLSIFKNFWISVFLEFSSVGYEKE